MRWRALQYDLYCVQNHALFKVSREVGAILKLRETRDAMLLQGAEAVYATPDEFDRFQRAEIVK